MCYLGLNKGKRRGKKHLSVHRVMQTYTELINSSNTRIIAAKKKIGRGLIPDRGSCLLSTQLTEDRLRHASGPVQPSVPLHELHKIINFFPLCVGGQLNDLSRSAGKVSLQL